MKDIEIPEIDSSTSFRRATLVNWMRIQPCMKPECKMMVLENSVAMEYFTFPLDLPDNQKQLFMV